MPLPRHIEHFAKALLCLMLCTGLSLNAQKIEPDDAPVMDFKLPLFGDQGYKAWEITGHEGRYLGQERILVLLMTIKIFSGDADLELESVISSPDATIDIKEKTAHGKSTLHVQGKQYRVRGKGWTWRGEDNRIVVHENARVEFAQPIGNLLNY